MPLKKSLLFLIIILIANNNIYAALPSSVNYCRDHGGEISTKNNNLGMYICVFPDKTECSAQSYYKKECKPGMFTDWIDKNVSTKTQLSLGLSSAGYISNRNPPKNINALNQNKLQYTKKDKAWFYYMRLNVSNSNQNSKKPVSHPAKIIMKKNGTSIKTYTIKPIKKDKNSSDVNIFIPIKDKGLYTFFLLPTEGDEVENKQEHFPFDNKVSKKLTNKEIKERSLAKWRKAQEKAKKTREEKEKIAKRKKYPIDSLPERCGFSDLYYGEVKHTGKVYYLVSMNPYSRIYDQFILYGIKNPKLIGKTIIFHGDRIIGGRGNPGFEGKLGGRVFQVVKNNKINNLKKIKSLCSRLQKQAEGKL